MVHVVSACYNPHLPVENVVAVSQQFSEQKCTNIQDPRVYLNSMYCLSILD